jgi:hypothetical protein
MPSSSLISTQRISTQHRSITWCSESWVGIYSQWPNSIFSLSGGQYKSCPNTTQTAACWQQKAYWVCGETKENVLRPVLKTLGCGLSPANPGHEPRLDRCHWLWTSTLQPGTYTSQNQEALSIETRNCLWPHNNVESKQEKPFNLKNSEHPHLHLW